MNINQLGVEFYKRLSFTVIGAAVGISLTAFSMGRSAVTRDDLRTDMPAMIAQYSPYTADAKAIAVQLQQLKDQNTTASVNNTQQYQHIEDQISQMQEDIARIAAKSGITAHPGPNGN